MARYTLPARRAAAQSFPESHRGQSVVIHQPAQNAGRNEVQDVFFFADENCVAGVIAPLCADDDVRLLSEHIDDFAFAFVAPLGAD